MPFAEFASNGGCSLVVREKKKNKTTATIATIILQKKLLKTRTHCSQTLVVVADDGDRCFSLLHEMKSDENY